MQSIHRHPPPPHLKRRGGPLWQLQQARAARAEKQAIIAEHVKQNRDR